MRLQCIHDDQEAITFRVLVVGGQNTSRPRCAARNRLPYPQLPTLVDDQPVCTKSAAATLAMNDCGPGKAANAWIHERSAEHLQSSLS
jgi:hypothetical protein